jgi:Family of unknown function (DUF5946)
MDSVQFCLECGAPWKDGITCQENFHQMLAWESDNPEMNYDVHHLMVLSYYLQHPSLYSPEGLSGAVQLLVDFLESGLTPQEVRRRKRNLLDSSRRNWKIGSTEALRGAYKNPVRWDMIATDVIAGGVEHYAENVRAWAQSILDVLRASGNLPKAH